VTYRHPAVVANIAATIDHVSGGRLELGMGTAWYEIEHQQYGIPFPRIGVRMDMLDEACHILRGLWTQKSTTFEGKHYQRRVGRAPHTADRRRALTFRAMLAESEAAAQSRVTEIFGGPLPEQRRQMYVVGTPGQCVEALRPGRRARRAGAAQVAVHFRGARSSLTRPSELQEVAQ
jgi:alkanesulfonate monooxygenase SsuD/methylene tetrahydromethanopterin reductase-like flavin-dependent oxidoreductase (luciferase family)